MLIDKYMLQMTTLIKFVVNRISSLVICLCAETTKAMKITALKLFINIHGYKLEPKCTELKKDVNENRIKWFANLLITYFILNKI